MSEIRKHLEAMKDEYRSMRYPGSLAEDVLDRSRWSSFRITSYVAVPLGLAAALLIWLGHRSATSIPAKSQPAAVAIVVKPVSPAIAATSRPKDETMIPMNAMSSELSFPSMQLTPSMSSLVPEAPSLDFGSAPSMPSMDVNFQGSTQNSATTKESV